MAWKALVERQSGHKIKRVRSDNGGEYIAGVLAKHLSTEGIIHEFTIPHCPQQNGAAEPLNKILLHKCRALLHSAGCAHSFGGEALVCAKYLRNLSPSSSLTVTPIEKWTGSQPSVAHLRVWGSLCHVLVKGHRLGKLEKRSWEGYLMGYDQHGRCYRIWNPVTQRIVLSRGVVFDEGILYHDHALLRSKKGTTGDLPSDFVPLPEED